MTRRFFFFFFFFFFVAREKPISVITTPSACHCTLLSNTYWHIYECATKRSDLFDVQTFPCALFKLTRPVRELPAKAKTLGRPQAVDFAQNLPVPAHLRHSTQTAAIQELRNILSEKSHCLKYYWSELIWKSIMQNSCRLKLDLLAFGW